MALQTITATGASITFCNVQELNRQKSAMGLILQKYTRYFRDFWHPDYPEFTHLEYCLDTCQLTFYTFDKEIDHCVLLENTVLNLENECREILCKIIKGTFL